MTGDVVRGVGGRRQEYRPIVSRLTPSSRPLDVALAIREHFGIGECYLADLDAIAGGEPVWPIYTILRDAGFRLWIDAGVRRVTQACHLADAGVESIVVGLETVEGPRQLADIAHTLGERMVFSLDLRQGEPLGNRDLWGGRDAESIAVEAVRCGVRRLLVLDLARVGLGGGTGTRNLCARLSAAFPNVEISAGGGVRNRSDLEELIAYGARIALTASALHDGRLTRADLDRL